MAATLDEGWVFVNWPPDAHYVKRGRTLCGRIVRKTVRLRWKDTQDHRCRSCLLTFRGVV